MSKLSPVAAKQRVVRTNSGKRARGTTAQKRAASQLAAFFRRNGYVRRQNVRRLAAEGYMGYKKGDEVRLVAGSLTELKTIRRLLRQAGFKPGKPFAKARQWRQPVYGREAVGRFLALAGKGAGGSGS